MFILNMHQILMQADLWLVLVVSAPIMLHFNIHLVFQLSMSALFKRTELFQFTQRIIQLGDDLLKNRASFWNNFGCSKIMFRDPRTARYADRG